MFCFLTDVFHHVLYLPITLIHKKTINRLFQESIEVTYFFSPAFLWEEFGDCIVEEAAFELSLLIINDSLLLKVRIIIQGRVGQ